MNKNYNFDRNKLILPEYGRHVHKMVEFLMSLEDRQLRNNQAFAVIDVMGNINPTLRDTDGFKHKLWDHLFLISDFKLDVDSPFPIPTREEIMPHPVRPPYPPRNLHFKHYGRNVARMIQAVNQVPSDEPQRQDVVNNIARYMKSRSQEFNNENANNETIMNDIQSMSDSGMVINSNILNGVRYDHKNTNHNQQRYKKSNKPQGGKRAPVRFGKNNKKQ